MDSHTIQLAAAGVPLVYLAAALISRRPGSERAAIGFAASALGIAILSAVLLILTPAAAAPGLVLLDPFSATVLTLITFVGFIVIKYSLTYLNGDPRRSQFILWMFLTLTAVSALVIAGDLLVLVMAWIATSLALQKLLLFRTERTRAKVAARKKFIVARLGDAALIGAIIVMINAFETTSISGILDQARIMKLSGADLDILAIAPFLLVLAAILKSGQFPTHGWLGEVMETPTPVSALLHAGIINAGGFLIIRFADVMLLSGSAMHTLAVIGGFTALFGSIVMLTQTSIKVSLAYSTVAQMGFMLLQCGLGVFSAATLHLVAHSLYKAHAFLSSGRAVHLVRISRPSMTHKAQEALFAVASALGLYFLISVPFGGMAGKEPAILTMGAIYITGLSIYLSSLLATPGSRLLGLGLAGLATAFYLLLQNGFAALLAGAVPQPPAADAIDLGLMALAVASFALVAFAQVFSLPSTDRARSFYVHAAQGFYANAYFNRLIGALRIDQTSKISRTVS